MGIKRRRHADHFAAIPVEVLLSDACRTAPNYAFRALVVIAAQYRGRNNGDLALTWKTARAFGLNSKKLLIKSIGLLLERGLVQKTRQGGKRPMGPCLYAVTWHPIDECDGKLDVQKSLAASHAWVRWRAADAETVQSEDHIPAIRRGPRETKSSLQGDQTAPVSALLGDRMASIDGTPESAPSRSRCGGALPVLGRST
jgi:hypothetical protein